MLRAIDQDIWVAEQPLRYLGLSLGTRMTVVRLATADLAVISPIPVNETMAAQLNQLGTVSHIIAPNLYHYLFAANFKALYPQAIFWATPGLAAKKPDLAIDRIISTDDQKSWDGLAAIFFDGFRTLGLNACYFDESFPPLTQFAGRILGCYQSLSPSLLEKIATKDREKVKRSVEQVLRWDFDRVTMAHGSIVEQDGRTKFQQGYEKFLGQAVKRQS
jgi:Domain of unknown function (DUF4336)